MALRLRPLTKAETQTIKKWSQSRTEAARLVERGKIIHLASERRLVPQIAHALSLDEKMVRKWRKRFREAGLAGLEDAPRSGALARYIPEVKAHLIATALASPRDLG